MRSEREHLSIENVFDKLRSQRVLKLHRFVSGEYQIPHTIQLSNVFMFMTVKFPFVKVTFLSELEGKQWNPGRVILHSLIKQQPID